MTAVLTAAKAFCAGGPQPSNGHPACAVAAATLWQMAHCAASNRALFIKGAKEQLGHFLAEKAHPLKEPGPRAQPRR